MLDYVRHELKKNVNTKKSRKKRLLYFYEMKYTF